MLTSSELKQILDYLAIHGKKDSQLTPLPTYEHASIDDYIDYLAVIKDGDNKKVSYANLRDALIDAFSSQSSMIDDYPIEDSRNLVRSGGVFDAIKEKSIPDGSVDWDKLAQDVIDAIETHASTGVAFTSDLTQEITGDIAVRQAPLYNLNTRVNDVTGQIPTINESLRNLDERLDAVEAIHVIFDEGDTIVGNEGTDIVTGGAKVPTGNAVSEWGAAKADKVTTATENNFAAFNASGNIKDSGKKASDFATPDQVSDIIGTEDDGANDLTLYGLRARTDLRMSKLDGATVDNIVLVGANGSVKDSTKSLDDYTSAEEFEEFKNIFYTPTFAITPSVIFDGETTTLTATATLKFNNVAQTTFCAELDDTVTGWTTGTTSGTTRTFTKSVNAATAGIGATIGNNTTIETSGYTAHKDSNSVIAVKHVYYGAGQSDTTSNASTANTTAQNVPFNLTATIQTANNDYLYFEVPNTWKVTKVELLGTVVTELSLYSNTITASHSNYSAYRTANKREAGNYQYRIYFTTL